MLGLRSVPTLDPDRDALTVMNHALGGGMASRLFQEIREERGLGVLRVLVPRRLRRHRLSRDLRGHRARAGAGNARSDRGRARPARARRPSRGRSSTPAKGHLTGSLAMSLETSASRMRRLGRSELVEGEIPTLDEVIARIDAVTADDTRRVIDRVLRRRVREHSPSSAPTTRANSPRTLDACRGSCRMIRVGVFGAGGTDGRDRVPRR